MENAKIQKLKCDILGDFQTLCRRIELVKRFKMTKNPNTTQSRSFGPLRKMQIVLFRPRHFMLAFETNSICEILHCLLVVLQNDSPITKHSSTTKNVSKKVSRYGNSIVSCTAKGVEFIRILNSSIFSQHT